MYASTIGFMPTVGVGIGTTVPSVPLQIGTTSNNIYANYSVTGAGSIIYSSYATIPNVSGSTSYSGNLTVFSTAAYGRNSGGSIALGGLMYNFGGGNYMNSLARISGVQSNTTDTYDGDLVLESVNNGTMYERMRIKTNGNVGIGTTAPSAALHVNGTIKCTTIVSTSFTVTASSLATVLIANNTSNGYAGSTVIMITVNGLGLSVGTFAGTTVTASAYVAWDYGAPSYANVYGMVATRGDISITSSSYGVNFNVPSSSFYISYYVTILRIS